MCKECGIQFVIYLVHPEAVSYEEIFPKKLGLEGSKISWEKINVSYVEFFPKKILAQNSLRKKKLDYSQPRKFSSPNFLETKGNFTRNFLDHLIIELKSVQDEAYPFPALDDVYCYTYTRLCSLLYSHMHRVTQTFPQEP